MPSPFDIAEHHALGLAVFAVGHPLPFSSRSWPDGIAYCCRGCGRQWNELGNLWRPCPADPAGNHFMEPVRWDWRDDRERRAQVSASAARAFGDAEDAHAWLHGSLLILAGLSPLAPHAPLPRASAMPLIGSARRLAGAPGQPLSCGWRRPKCGLLWTDSIPSAKPPGSSGPSLRTENSGSASPPPNPAEDHRGKQPWSLTPDWRARSPFSTLPAAPAVEAF